MMQVIALTSANEAAMSAVAEQLLAAASAQQLQLSVMVGIEDAFGAEAVFTGLGELWRIGVDESKPELDDLVDRWINDEAIAALPAIVDQELARFLQRMAKIRPTGRAFVAANLTVTGGAAA